MKSLHCFTAAAAAGDASAAVAAAAAAVEAAEAAVAEAAGAAAGGVAGWGEMKIILYSPLVLCVSSRVHTFVNWIFLFIDP